MFSFLFCLIGLIKNKWQSLLGGQLFRPSKGLDEGLVKRRNIRLTRERAGWQQQQQQQQLYEDEGTASHPPPPTPPICFFLFPEPRIAGGGTYFHVFSTCCKLMNPKNWKGCVQSISANECKAVWQLLRCLKAFYYSQNLTCTVSTYISMYSFRNFLFKS